MPTVAAHNADLFYARAKLVEQLFGPLVEVDGAARLLEREDLKDRPQQPAQCIKHETTARWLRHVFSVYRRRL
jgi:hypothetical protein